MKQFFIKSKLLGFDSNAIADGNVIKGLILIENNNISNKNISTFINR